jgi:hypothetical protein
MAKARPAAGPAMTTLEENGLNFYHASLSITIEDGSGDKRFPLLAMRKHRS